MKDRQSFARADLGCEMSDLILCFTMQVSSQLLSSEAPAPSSTLGSTVTISSTNETIIGDPNNGTLVSNQTSPSQVVNTTTQVPAPSAELRPNKQIEPAIVKRGTKASSACASMCPLVRRQG